jgi:hypothetical protein
MLTCSVNIAVFAAFQPRVEGGLLSDRGFKRVCRGCRRRFGGKNGNDGGKNGKGGNEIVAVLRQWCAGG